MTASDGNGGGWLARLRALPNDSREKILWVAGILCLVCSVVVSTTAVLLKPLQERNAERAIRSEILKVAGIPRDDRSLEQAFEAVSVRLVDLRSGTYVSDVDAEKFDAVRAARSERFGVEIEDQYDLAGLRRRAKLAPVYLVGDPRSPDTIVLPVYGKGLWSTMFGFIALRGDTRTVRAITFYEHGETPGLGAEIDSLRWQRLWVDKLALDQYGEPRIEVIKGSVHPDSPDLRYQVDGISGATLTSDAVTALMHFWLGEQGFGPYLDRLRTGSI